MIRTHRPMEGCHSDKVSSVYSAQTKTNSSAGIMCGRVALGRCPQSFMGRNGLGPGPLSQALIFLGPIVGAWC